MASPNFRDNFEQKRGRLCRIFECRDHACGALADDDGVAAADDVDAVFALPHVIVARVGGIAHEGALAPLPHRSRFRRIAATHAAVAVAARRHPPRPLPAAFHPKFLTSHTHVLLYLTQRRRERGVLEDI